MTLSVSLSVTLTKNHFIIFISVLTTEHIMIYQMIRQLCVEPLSQDCRNFSLKNTTHH